MGGRPTRDSRSLDGSYACRSNAVAQVEILSEREGRNGWEFEAQALDHDGTLRRHRLTLSWADYNLWSADGGDEPVRVAEAVLLFMARRSSAASLPEKFDASLARRKFPGADQEIPGLITR
jgi:hypothetical protein